MTGIEFAAVRDAMMRAFNGDDFDMFLFERLDFDRAANVAQGPFKVVVTNVLMQAMREGWDPILVAEVAKFRPLKQDIQDVYEKYAKGLIDESRQVEIEDARLQALNRFGLTPMASIQSAGMAKAPAAMPYAEGFEKTIKGYLPMINVGLWRERLFKIEGQVCRVEVGNGIMGTGFLVGAGVVLTNYHVLKPVIEGQWPANKVRFRFDYRTFAGGRESSGLLAGLHATDWRISDGKYTDAEARNVPDETLPSPDELDYALVRLDGLIGNQPIDPSLPDSPMRGWVHVPAAAQPLIAKMPMLILQHPNAEPLKLAVDTQGVLSLNANDTRVRYATNTEGGSSGSPCFDIQWNLVALHHYGDPAFNHAPQFNQGIPIASIRNRLEREQKLAALGA